MLKKNWDVGDPPNDDELGFFFDRSMSFLPPDL